MKDFGKLKKELDRLVRKYGRGGELNLSWEQMPNGCREVHDKASQSTRYEEGCVDRDTRTLRVFSVKIEDALHTVRHEYFEYLLDEIVEPGDILFNEMVKGFCRAFNQTRYRDKERLIESLIKHEEKEDEENEDR